MADTNHTSVIYSTVTRILSPLIKLLLRYGVPYATFAELAKKTYVDVATQAFPLPDKPPTTAHIATITGLTRKEVLRVKKLPEHAGVFSEKGYNRAARVVSSWVTDRDYHDGRGAPAALPYNGKRKSFTALVKRYSGDIPARTILDELIRVGTVKHQKDGRLRLAAHVYIPYSADAEKIEILGTDVADLIATIDHNIAVGPKNAFYQRKVSFDNIPEFNIADLRTRVNKKAQVSLEALHRLLVKHDRDLNPKVHGEGKVRLGVGIYYFEEKIDTPDDE